MKRNNTIVLLGCFLTLAHPVCTKAEIKPSLKNEVKPQKSKSSIKGKLKKFFASSSKEEEEEHGHGQPQQKKPSFKEKLRQFWHNITPSREERKGRKKIKKYYQKMKQLYQQDLVPKTLPNQGPENLEEEKAGDLKQLKHAPSQTVKEIEQRNDVLKKMERYFKNTKKTRKNNPKLDSWSTQAKRDTINQYAQRMLQQLHVQKQPSKALRILNAAKNLDKQTGKKEKHEQKPHR